MKMLLEFWNAYLFIYFFVVKFCIALCFLFWICIMYIVHNSTDRTKGIFKETFFFSKHFNPNFLDVYWPGIPCYLKISWRTWRILRRRSTLSSSPLYTASTWRTLSRLSFFIGLDIWLQNPFLENLFILIVRNDGWNPEKVSCFIWSEMGKQINWKY